MNQKFDIGLNSKINDFCNKYGIIRSPDNDDNVFETFGNYVISSLLLEQEVENLNSVSTGLSQGIDGIVIIINDRLITEVKDLDKIGDFEPINVKIAFIQSTIKNSFNEEKFRSFVDETIKFLAGETIIEPFSTIYNKLLDESGPYIDRLVDTFDIQLFFLSGRTNFVGENDLIDAEKSKFNRNDIVNKCKIQKIEILQKGLLKENYDKIAKFHKVSMAFESNVQLKPIEDVELSLLTTIKFKELKKLILTQSNNLKSRLFVENVRNFLDETPVNLDIKKTLDNSNQRIFFPFINNGLTIMCDKVERHPVKPDEYILTFPRIINGCQTTHMLYKKYKEGLENIDDIEVVAKIISTDNQDLKKKIIYAANNQNSIDKDLQSLNDFHEKVEQFYSGVENPSVKLYFERLRGQHSQISPPYSKIDIETIARVYISAFLKEPDTMKSNAIKKIQQFQNGGLIFRDATSIADYYFCGILHYWMNYFLINNSISFNSKSMDMHVLLTCKLLLDKKGYTTTEQKIEFMKNVDNALQIFSETTIFVNGQNYLFDRRGFYSKPKVRQMIEILML